MKEKTMKKLENTDTSATDNSTVLTPSESLSEMDRAQLENSKMKAELALEKVKTAIAQKENAEVSYNNFVLQLALKHKLNEGDVIEENGTIKRNT